MVDSIPTVDDELSRKVWITKGARFAAHRRLRRKHFLSVWAVAILSTYLIAGTLLGPLLLTAQRQPVINSGLVIASILVLVLSLIEASHGYQLRAERLHDCGMELGNLELALRETSSEIVGPERDAQLRKLRLRYARILERCRENHEEIDVASFKAGYPGDFKVSDYERASIQVRLFLTNYAPYLLAIVTPLLVAMLLLW